MDVAQPVRIAAAISLLHELRAFHVRGKHRLERSCGSGRRLLRDIAEPGPARHVDRSFVGVDQADDRLHQGGLARAVPADQPNMSAGRNRRRRAVKDRASAEADR